MKIWKLFVLILLIGYAAYYYKVPENVYKSLLTLNPKQSGFESDNTNLKTPTSKLLVNAAATSTRETVAVVTRAVVGDTIVIDTGEKVRYIGMNTPESVDPRKPVECFGKEALDYNKNLVVGKKVRLVKDVGNKDVYGRLLRYVYLPDGTFVNLKLVEDGYASVMTVPPNVSKASEFVAAERMAREKKVGLWSMCK